MLPGNVSLRSRPRRVGNSVVSSWTRTLAVAAVLLLAFIVLAALALTGRLGDLRYANIPLAHPYPPAGYYLNPFNPGDRGDLIHAGEAARVKADLLVDGQTELRAIETGDASLVAQADTGNAGTALQKVIAEYNAQGIFARQTSIYSSIVVGRVVDPNAPSVSWCVQERGTATITFLSRSSGQVVRQESFRFNDRFWLVSVNGRYLITDAEISNQPGAGG
jgi:hypothetical protein